MPPAFSLANSLAVGVVAVVVGGGFEGANGIVDQEEGAGGSQDRRRWELA